MTLDDPLLLSAIKCGSVERVKKALEAGEDPSDRTFPLGGFPFSLGNCLEVVYSLVMRKKDSNMVEIMRLLVDRNKFTMGALTEFRKDLEQDYWGRSRSQETINTLETMVPILENAIADLNQKTKLLFSEENSDVQFRCRGEETIFAHKKVLEEKCPEYFQNQIGYKSKNNPGETVQFQPTCSGQVMKAILSYIYINSLEPTDNLLAESQSNWSEVLWAADHYHLSKVVELVQIHMKENLCLSTFKTTLTLAHFHGLNDLKEDALKLVPAYMMEAELGNFSEPHIKEDYPELWKEIVEKAHSNIKRGHPDFWKHIDGGGRLSAKRTWR